MFKPKVQISKQLNEKVRVAATTLGVSVEEFVEKSLQDAADKVILSQSQGGGSDEISKEEEEAIANQLKGLGYLE